jgi:hypothetical protein
MWSNDLVSQRQVYSPKSYALITHTNSINTINYVYHIYTPAYTPINIPFSPRGDYAEYSISDSTNTGHKFNASSRNMCYSTFTRSLRSKARPSPNGDRGSVLR